MDPDIPVAYASPITVDGYDYTSTAHGTTSTTTSTAYSTDGSFGKMDAHHPKPGLTRAGTGRSSRVMVPDASLSSRKILSNQERDALQSQGFTAGLMDAMIQNCQYFPLRIWVVDNSGSMATGDGHRMIETSRANDVRMVTCTRWTELQETVDYHCQMAALLQAPTVFRLLNDPGKIVGPQQFSIGEQGPESIPHELQIARSTMKQATPSGVTPLALHLTEIRANVRAMQEELQDTGRKVAVILATDGLPTDPYGHSGDGPKRDFETSLRNLEGLPVWVVIRLCTDEDAVVDYYNNLDSQLELSLEVLDDFCGEAQEVVQFNPWLNYALVVHRIREMGFHHRLFDLLDERALTLDEVKDFFVLLFGPREMDGTPDPQLNFNLFLDHMAVLVSRTKRQWNPMTKKVEPLIDMKRLKKQYGAKGGCTIM